MRSIQQLIQASVESEELLPRSRAAIERQLDDYYIFEVDRNPVACVALHVYPGENKGELACLCVRPSHENQGIGRRMVQFVEDRAREVGLDTLFALSTQAFNFFRSKAGFTEGTPEDLPAARRESYEQSGRRSQGAGETPAARLERARGGLTGTALAPFFRDRGRGQGARPGDNRQFMSVKRLAQPAAALAEPVLDPEDVRRATELLEAIAADRALLADVPLEMRQALLIAAGRVSRPQSYQEKRLVKALRRARRRRDEAADREARAATGIRAAREAPVFVPPSPALAGRGRGGAAARAQEAQELLRLQGRVHAAPPLLRRPVPRVRRAELRQALPDRFPGGAGGARDGRPREDRLPDRAQDAPGRRPGHRHHAVPGRRGRCATPASPTSRSGRTASTSTAWTCGTRRASRSSPGTWSTPSTAWTSSSTTPARPCGGLPRSTRTCWRTSRGRHPTSRRRSAASCGATRP